jgi:hypothetical protein
MQLKIPFSNPVNPEKSCKSCPFRLLSTFWSHHEPDAGTG